jgi:hypothetical protein
MSCIRIEKGHAEHFSEEGQRNYTAEASPEERWNPSRYPNAFMNNLNGDILNALTVASAMTANGAIEP